jgi:proline iminopeptidase
MTMGKFIVIVSGILAILAWFGGEWLYLHDSHFADFVRILCFPFLTLVFLVALFATRIRRMPLHSATRRTLRALRAATLAGIAVLAVVLFWPRNYGGPQRIKSDSTHYWNLPTGSRLAYWKIPAKATAKPTPIIYLQGGPGGTIDGSLIHLMTPIAEDGYDIYLYDQLGCGWSDRLDNIRDYTVTRHVQDLEAIVQTIGAPKVILIGQSWGAILATAYTADNPGKVAALLVTGPGPIQPAHPQLARVIPPDSFHFHDPYYTNHQGNDLANNIRTRCMTIVAASFGKKLASDEEADNFANYASKLVNRSTVADTAHIGPLFPANPPPTSSGPVGFYVGLMTVHSFKNTPDPRPKLKNTPIPILVMKGQYDNQKWGFTKEYLDIFPNHQLAIIPNAGHGIFIEQRELYLTTIRKFLTNHQY